MLIIDHSPPPPLVKANFLFFINSSEWEVWLEERETNFSRGPKNYRRTKKLPQDNQEAASFIFGGESPILVLQLSWRIDISLKQGQ